VPAACLEDPSKDRYLNKISVKDALAKLKEDHKLLDKTVTEAVEEVKVLYVGLGSHPRKNFLKYFLLLQIEDKLTVRKRVVSDDITTTEEDQDQAQDE